MIHDLDKLHPTQRLLYEQFVAEPKLPNEVPDELYLHYLDVSENYVDLIGKRPEKMTKKQRQRFDKKINEMKRVSINISKEINNA